MFETRHQIKMYDTDAAGILYFGAQFRFAHDAFEALMKDGGYTIADLLHREPFMFVIVHAESDYFHPTTVGDELIVHTAVTHIGTTSFSLTYNLFKDKVHVGKARTVHVCIDKNSRQKLPLPKKATTFLNQYFDG